MTVQKKPKPHWISQALMNKVKPEQAYQRFGVKGTHIAVYASDFKRWARAVVVKSEAPSDGKLMLEVVFKGTNVTDRLDLAHASVCIDPTDDANPKSTIIPQTEMKNISVHNRGDRMACDDALRRFGSNGTVLAIYHPEQKLWHRARTTKSQWTDSTHTCLTVTYEDSQLDDLVLDVAKSEDRARMCIDPTVPTELTPFVTKPLDCTFLDGKKGKEVQIRFTPPRPATDLSCWMTYHHSKEIGVAGECLTLVIEADGRASCVSRYPSNVETVEYEQSAAKKGEFGWKIIYNGLNAKPILHFTSDGF